VWSRTPHDGPKGPKSTPEHNRLKHDPTRRFNTVDDRRLGTPVGTRTPHERPEASSASRDRLAILRGEAD
jgi:hypothetical protein